MRRREYTQVQGLSRRFDSAEKLASYAGLSPKHHNSGETVRTGGITKRGSVWLRTAMVEAAFTAIRHDARIGARYQKLAARIGTTKGLRPTGITTYVKTSGHSQALIPSGF